MKFNPSYVEERPDVLSLIRPGIRNLLDIGCSDGTFALSVKNKFKSVEVLGVELDPSMASVAKQRLDMVHIADLNKVNLSNLFPEKTFDCIVMADVLEHLIDPWNIIKQASSLLADNGRIVTSIPNVRHISTVISLVLKGKWPYRKRGIHDMNHLRFFTHSNIVEMFDKAELKIVREKRNMRIVERSFKKIDIFAKLFDILGLREFFTIQYLHECVLSDE